VLSELAGLSEQDLEDLDAAGITRPARTRVNADDLT
jgi:hypothetical protein